MAPPDENEPNPYQAPKDFPVSAGDPVRSTIDPELVKKFRQQIHALGGLWIIIGSAALAWAVFGFGARGRLWGDPDPDFFSGEVLVLLVTIAVTGSVYLSVGVAACLKHMWAVYAGLVLGYVSLLAQLAKFNVCGIFIIILVIVQAHRVIRWTRQMHAAGVPLTARPDTIAGTGQSGLN
jgi:hypothetical protein